jgi:hypothetical protein
VGIISASNISLLDTSNVVTMKSDGTMFFAAYKLRTVVVVARNVVEKKKKDGLKAATKGRRADVVVQQSTMAFSRPTLARWRIDLERR